MDHEAVREVFLPRREDCLEGSSLPMIGDWDTDRQPAVALREPMAQRGQSKIDAGGMVVWERLSSQSLPHRRWGSGRKPLLQKPSFYRSGFRRDHCVIEDGGLGLKSYLNRSCDEGGGLRPSPIIRRHEPQTDWGFS